MATRGVATRAYRWVASERPSFDPAVGGQVIGTGRVVTGSSVNLRLPDALPLPCFVAVDVRSCGSADWLHVGHDWIWDSADRRIVEARPFPSLAEPATQYLHCVVLTVRQVERTPGEVSVDDEYLPAAAVVLMPYESGTPPPGSSVLRSETHGSVRQGPLVGEEWYADISAVGHCPVRVLIPVGPKGHVPEVAVHLFPSRRKIGRVLVDGRRPPVGTLLKVTPELVRGVVVGTYFGLKPDGAFEIDEPILGGCTYEVYRGPLWVDFDLPFEIRDVTPEKIAAANKA